MNDGSTTGGTAEIRFDRPVAPDGYRWWYVDALSDDGAYGITLIAFLGSVFSPWYAWARRRGPADPLRHCALNVALYGRKRRWALTERPRGAVGQDRSRLAIGPSALDWDGTALTVTIDEVTAPVPSRVRGTVRVWPEGGALGGEGGTYALDQAGRHRWTPLAPVARVEVALDRPALRWSGRAYLDSNEGDAPLERDFTEWDWCRAPTPDGTAILYEATRRDGSVQSLALLARAGTGSVKAMEPPPACELPPTPIWRMRRRTRSDAGQHGARVLRTLEDTPFYSRSVLGTRLAGTDATAVHESLHLPRFSHPVVQAMLPFRVPKRWR